MKILFVSSYDVSDLQNGNGIDHFKLQALRAADCDVTPVSPIALRPASRSIVSRGILKLERLLTSNLDVVHRKRFLRKIGAAIAAHPAHAAVDAIVCPNHFDISFYRGALPVFFWTDATHANMVAGDLPLKFHPVAVRVSADVTPFGAV